MRLARWLLRRVTSERAATAIEGDLLESHDPERRPSLGTRLRMVAGLFGIAASLWHAERRPRFHPADVARGVGRDLEFAVRMLIARPALSAVAILSLALGIGANTAIFSVLDAVLLRPLPVAEPDRLVSTGTSIFSYPDVRDLGDRTQDVFETFATWETTSRARGLRGPAGVELVPGQLVSGGYFELLGSRPLLGRLIGQADDDADRPVVVLSERVWRRSFAADPAVVGSQVSVNDLPATVVGVTARGFAGHRLNRAIDFWMPLSLHPQLARGSRTRMRLEDRRIQWLRGMGRLRSGVTGEQARQSVNAAIAGLAEEYPDTYLSELGQIEELIPATRWAVPRNGEVRSFLRLMAGMVGVALLVACANVANLLLGRSVERRREIGVRMALGAPRRRLLRQLLTESALLALLGGAAGLLFAHWTVGTLASLQLPGRITLGDLQLGIDPTLLAFTAGIALTTGLVFGLAPAWAATRPDPAEVIGANDSRRGSGASRLPSLLVAAQTALTMALLIGGGLFARSLTTALDVDFGFEPREVAVAQIDLGIAGYDEDRTAPFYRRALASARALPQVEAAAWAVYVPVGGGMSMEPFLRAGADSSERGDVSLNYVSDGYFETLRLPLLEGRGFDAHDDADGAPVAIVNATMAAQQWPDGAAVGSTILMPGAGGALEIEIIAIAADSKLRRLREEPQPYLYRPLAQWTWLIGANRMQLAARTAATAPETVLPLLRDALQSIDPKLPVSGLRTLEQQHYDLIMPQRVGALLLGLFALLALVLAGVGIYGVVSNAVTRRVHEIGIRRALGADRRRVVQQQLVRGMIPILIGLPAGAVLAVAGSGLIGSFLPGLSATDPLTFLTTGALLLAVALLACIVPALRAARIDPVGALRAE